MTHLSEFLGAGTLDLFAALNIAAATAAYVVGVRRVSRMSSTRWPLRSSVCFFLAMILLALVGLGPLAAWAHTFFWVHMTQHLVITMAAAPLIVLGNPLGLAVAASGARTRERLHDILGSRWVRWLTDPVVTWVLFSGALVSVHFTSFYDWALSNHAVMVAVEQPLFLMVATLYYLPLIGDNPLPHRPSHGVRLLSLALMMIPEAIVGAVIYFAPVVLYDSYDVARPFGPDPLADQQLSGAVMWCVVMVIETFWMMVVAGEWWAADERQGRAESEDPVPAGRSGGPGSSAR